MFELGDAFAQVRVLFFCELAQLAVTLTDERIVRLNLCTQIAKLPVRLDRSFELGAFLYQRRVTGLIESARRVGKLRVDLVEAPRHRMQAIDQRAAAAFFASRAALRAAASSCLRRATAER